MKGLTARFAACVLTLTLTSGTLLAGEPWLAPGDVQVRHDIQWLVDAGVIELPMSGWPIPIPDLAHALANAATRDARDAARRGRKAPPSALPGSPAPVVAAFTPAESAALTRLRNIAVEGRPGLGFELNGAARPMELRTFANTPREEGELGVHAAGFFGERYGARLEVTGAVDPDDDKAVRFDGSYVAGTFGNWIVTLGAQERWWGSGWDGSLILSNNARPVPAIALDRAVSEPFETKWLSWLGPWRLTTFMGRMESDRQDYANPLLFGMRVAARPLDGLEISLERTAQWCGEGRECGWGEFWNLFSGNDNAGENVIPEDEPGNQLAGWDIRWASPIGDWPYALYFQHTGESIDNNIPRPYRSLELAGGEIWGEAASGASWRTSLEWALSRCGGTQDGQKLWDCAYNNTIFNPDGYRYYGRAMGHSMDSDGEMYSLRFLRLGTDAKSITALVRFTQINQGGAVPDTRHPIAPGPEDWISLDFSYRRPFLAGWIEAGVGVDKRSRDWNDTDSVLPRASIQWQYELR